MGSDGAEDQRSHTVVTSQNGCLKVGSESRGKHGIALDGEGWYDVRHCRLIISPDGTAKEEEDDEDGNERYAYPSKGKQKNEVDNINDSGLGRGQPIQDEQNGVEPVALCRAPANVM